MSVQTLLKLRDAIQMAADALNEELEKHAPPETEEHQWNPEAMKWIEAEGSRGPQKDRRRPKSAAQRGDAVPSGVEV